MILTPAKPLLSQWEKQESGVSTILWDVCFVDSLHGWVVGDSATIIATTDGGKHWEPQTHSAPKFSLKIYKTTDGGKHWNTIGRVSSPLYEMSLVPPDTIWAGRFGFARSTDGGVNWAERYWPITEVMAIGDIDQVDGRTGWLTCSASPGSKPISRILYTVLD